MPQNVWILSKGRPNNLSSALFSKWSIPHTVWIEPQDEALYRAAIQPHAQLRLLPQNNGGISYVRNHLLAEGRRLYDEDTAAGGDGSCAAYWMCDDDIIKLNTIAVKPDSTRLIRINDEAHNVLDSLEREFMNSEIGHGAPYGDVYVWAAGKIGLKMDSPSYFINWIHPGRIDRDIQFGIDGREDQVFAAAVMLSGGRCAQHSGYSVHVAPIGNPNGTGGLVQQYIDYDKIVSPASAEFANRIESSRAILVSSMSDGKDKDKFSRMKVVRWFHVKWGNKGLYNAPRWSALRKLVVAAQKSGIELIPGSMFY